jgi:tetratricopeptide (TPR) repeat protein
MRSAVLAWVAAILVALCARAAWAADDDPTASAEAHFHAGEANEEHGAYPEALTEYRAAQQAAPATRWAVRAGDRIEWLRNRSEGDFAPLRRLEQVRRDPDVASDPAAIDALARDAEGFPPGMVRVEARMLVAEAWLGRMRRPADAIHELTLVRDDRKTDPLTSRLAERELVDAYVGEGRVDDAVAEVKKFPARLDPRFARQVKRLVVRRTVNRFAVVVLAAFGLLSLVGLVRAGLRRTLGQAWAALRDLAPPAIGFVAFVAIAGGVLASQYESGNATPFLLLGAAVLPLVLLARAWGAVGSQTRAARLGRALLCAATVVAAAFVLLEKVYPDYLVGFGL